jgi:cadmium resistance protein CadD (predicted permease)
VPALVTTIAVAAAAFIGTTFDNFFALAAQLAVTDSKLFQRIGRAHVTGIMGLVAISGAAGSALSTIPLKWVAILALAPFSLGVVAWRHRNDAVGPVFKRGATTTFLVAIALGGDNIAVWTPLLRAAGVTKGIETAAVFFFLELLLVLLAKRLASRPRIIAWGQRYARHLTPFVYVALSFLIIGECGLL